MSSNTCGLLWVLVTPRSARGRGTSFAAHRGAPKAVNRELGGIDLLLADRGRMEFVDKKVDLPDLWRACQNVKQPGWKEGPVRSVNDGVIGVVCGVGGLAAVAGVGWWYMTQADGVLLDSESLTISGNTPANLPVASIHRRLGDTVPAWMPLDWRVEPASLASIEGGRLVPREAGSGVVFACLGQYCDSAALTVAMVDAVSTTPAKAVAFRLWTPRSIEAAAVWKGEPVSVPLVWSTADPAVATVSDAGVLTPVGPGSTELRVEAMGVATTLAVTVHPEPPGDCTLAKYAEAMGSAGPKKEDKSCDPDDPDMCSGESKQALVGGGTLAESWGLDNGSVTLSLPGIDVAEAWQLAARCLELPPEVAALDMPTMLKAKGSVKKVVRLAGEWDGDAQATVEINAGKAEVQLPSGCTGARSFSVDRAGGVTMGTFVGC